MNEQMKNFLKRFGGFLLILPLFYIVLIFFRGVTKPVFDSGYLGPRLEDLDNVEEVDILVVGSSRSYRHYDPRIFKKRGINLFVLGSSAQSIIQTHFFIKNYIDKLDPDLVIFDVYPEMFTSEGVESTLDILENSNKNLELGTYSLAYNHTYVKVFNDLIYSYINELIFNPDLEVSGDPEDTYIKGGYVESVLTFAGKEDYQPRFIAFNKEQIEAFDEIIVILNKNDVELMMVQSPMHKGRLESYENLYLVDSLMNSKSLELLDFNKNLKTNDSIDFLDSTHLNQIGVEKFNDNFVREILAAKYKN